MFLDDELLQICKDAKLDTPESVQKLNIIICRKCEGYYKSKLYFGMSKKEVIIILDRTFNLFNSFILKALKSEDKKLIILGEVFQKVTFKTQFLSNKKMNEVYNNLKNEKHNIQRKTLG